MVLFYHTIVQAINAPLSGHVFTTRSVISGRSVGRRRVRCIRTLRHDGFLAATFGGAGCGLTPETALRLVRCRDHLLGPGRTEAGL